MGKNASKVNDNAVSIPPVLKSKEPPVTATPSQVLVLPDGITIVWLDVKVNSDSNDGLSTKTMLSEIHPSVFVFDDVKGCLDFLNQIGNRTARIFLVVSGKFSSLILSHLKTFPTIDSVFIFCAHPERYEHLVVKYSPYVIGIFDEQEKLRLRLKIELNNYNLRAPVFNFFAQKQSAIRDLTYDAASFLWFQLLQKVLMQTEYDKNDMEQMLAYCHEYYARDPQQKRFLSDIEEFQRSYQSSKAINWYTRQSFIYKLINTALRMEDIKALYIFRFYIADLCRQLAVEHKNFCIQNQKSPILTLYRGCHMTLEEMEKLRDTVGGMTSINGFISTSLQKWVADLFVFRASHRQAGMQKVLWIIKADCRLDDVIFASVASYSDIPEEEEVLFDIGSAFLIDDVTIDEATNVWHVKATATNAGVRAVSEYMKLIKHELNEHSVEVIFGTLLMDMGKYITAQLYFEDLIQRFSDSGHPDLAAFHYNLGLTYSFQKDLDLAEHNFRRAQEYQKLDPLKQRDVVRTLNALGWVYQDNGQLPEAMHSYRGAETICQEQLTPDDLANAQTYTYMGRYYLERQKYSKSNICYERAMKILRLHLSDQHQRIGIIFNEMGDLSRKQGDAEQALKIYERAEAIFRDILPQHHPCMAYCWSGMGLVFLKLNDIEKAQRYHRKALESYKRVLPPDHMNISISEKNLKCINYAYIIDSYLQVCSQV